jgi:hypothetical protein
MEDAIRWHAELFGALTSAFLPDITHCDNLRMFTAPPIAQVVATDATASRNGDANLGH